MKKFNIKVQLTACFSILLVCAVYASCVGAKTMEGELGEGEFKALPYKILSDTLNATLPATEGKVQFVIDKNYFEDYETLPALKTSVNGVWKTITPDANGKFEYSVEPGSYAFQFYVNDQFMEITVPKIKVEKQHDVTVKLMFYHRRVIMAEKPVIYIYSDEELPLTIGVKPKGEMVFTYPQTHESWKGTATGNGFKIAGKHYPYLFWEAKMTGMENLEWENSSFISKNEVIAYLEKVCMKAGLNDNERTDLITYWGPRMMKYEYSEVLAITDGADELFGDLSVSNDEFKVERFYLVFRQTASKKHQINLETLRTFKRTSMFILEWGGADATQAHS